MASPSAKRFCNCVCPVHDGKTDVTVFVESEPFDYKGCSVLQLRVDPCATIRTLKNMIKARLEIDAYEVKIGIFTHPGRDAECELDDAQTVTGPEFYALAIDAQRLMSQWKSHIKARELFTQAVKFDCPNTTGIPQIILFAADVYNGISNENYFSHEVGDKLRGLVPLVGPIFWIEDYIMGSVRRMLRLKECASLPGIGDLSTIQERLCPTTELIIRQPHHGTGSGLISYHGTNKELHDILTTGRLPEELHDILTTGRLPDDAPEAQLKDEVVSHVHLEDWDWW